MRLISVLKCHAVTLVLRASPLNWALCVYSNRVSDMEFQSSLELIEYINQLKSNLIESDNTQASKVIEEGLMALNGLTDGWAMLLESIELVQSEFNSELNEYQLTMLDTIQNSLRKVVYRS